MKSVPAVPNSLASFTRKRMTTAISAAAMVTAMSATPAYAAIEEIVITTQKREQTLQDVPITVSAFTGDFMESAQITDAKEVALLTPGVAGDTDDSFLDTINIRGISTNDFGVGAEPSVGVYQNGVYLGRTGGALSSFFDIARVEVVKGPQGTLFGRNASAGAFSIQTNMPTAEQEGSIDIGLGEDGYREFSGVYNLPLSDEWAARFALYRQEQDAWVKNAATGEDVGDLEVTAGRFTISHEGENVTTSLMLEYEDRMMPPTLYRVFDPDNTGLDFFQSNVAKKDEFESDRSPDQMLDEGEVWGATLNIEADLGDGYTLTSITGLRGHNYYYHEDFDGSTANIFNYEQIQEQDYFSQELRLNYDGDGPISWFVGASIYKEDLKTHYNQTFDEDTMCATWAAAGYYSAYYQDAYNAGYIQDCASYYSYYTWQNYYAGDYTDWNDWETNGYYNTDYFANSVYYGPGNPARNDEVDVDAEYEGWGIYGDVTWQVTDDLDITVGGRYTEDKRDFAVSHIGGPNAYFFYGFPYFTSSPVSASNTWSNFSGRLALNWDVNEDVSVYGNISTGYKAGGYNTFFLNFTNADPEAFPFQGWIDASVPLTADSYPDMDPGDIDALAAEVLVDPSNRNLGAVPEEFDKEEVTNYEIGIKSILFDGTMHLNANAYFYDFTDMQAGAYKNGSIYLLRNVGDAEGYGFETDIRWVPNENFDLYLGMAWADTELTKADDEFCDIVSCDEGAQLSGTIEFSAALVATYTIPLESGNIGITWETFHQDDSPGFGEFNKDPLMLDGFTTSNLRIGYNNNDDWSLSFWVNNITDEFYYKGVAGQEGNLAPHHFGFSEPRRMGVRFSMNF